MTDCVDKAAYLDKAQAKAMSRAVSAKNVHRGDLPTHVYTCPLCGLYHVGHVEPYDDVEYIGTPEGQRWLEDENRRLGRARSEA